MSDQTPTPTNPAPAAVNGAGTGAASPAPETVPYDRFQQVVRERDAAKAEVQRWSERAATADTLAAQLKQEQATRARERAEWDQDLALVDEGGITDRFGRKVARVLYGELPEAERPKSIGDWIKGLKAEGAAVPKPLQPYLAPVEPAAGASKGADGTRTKMPSAPAGGSAPAGAPLSPEAIRAIRERAVATGDWEPYKAVRPQIQAMARGGRMT